MRIAAAIAGLAFASLIAGTTNAEDRAPPVQPLLHGIVSEISPAEQRATITRLVAFGTRHTLSDTISKTRGIGAARRWVASRFADIGKHCGHCFDVETPEQMVQGERIPKPADLMDVLAIQRGASDPNRIVIISGHLNSRVTDPMNATSDAPGADDDGSGTAAVLEAARVLSKYKFPATIVFAVLSGEEQGLYGGKLLAQYAQDHHWQVEAVLNNDIVGNTNGENGVTDATHVRVFSEGTRSTETPDEATRRRYNGGEVDSPSRNIARFISGIADRYLTDFKVRMVYRTDRFSRGGDQVPMLAAGYPAVRFTEAIENYTREHQDVRKVGDVQYGDVAEAIDYPYLAQVTRLNTLALAALARAPAPPLTVKIEGAVTQDTKVSWAAVPGAAGYRVWWRDTTAPFWTNSQSAGTATTLTLKNTNIDDWFFGVSSVSADGFESPVEFPGPAGAFVPSPVAPAK